MGRMCTDSIHFILFKRQA
uniref:Uncharacterized protein n=1 Tax=Arundo donax TaxID=35708 RepID=A0A0A8YS65_ARUDO